MKPVTAIILAIILALPFGGAGATPNATVLLNGYYAQAVLDWGRPDLVQVITWSVDVTAYPGGAMAWAAPIKAGCTIGVSPTFWSIDPVYRQTVIDHEMGHCMGLGHVPDGEISVMNANVARGRTPTLADGARLRAVRPLRYSVRAEVAR